MTRVAVVTGSLRPASVRPSPRPPMRDGYRWRDWTSTTRTLCRRRLRRHAVAAGRSAPVHRRLGPIDAVVTAAGHYERPRSPISPTPHCTGCCEFTSAGCATSPTPRCQSMIDRRQAAIVAVTSELGHRRRRQRRALRGGQGRVIGLVRSLAAEVADARRPGQRRRARPDRHAAARRRLTLAGTGIPCHAADRRLCRPDEVAQPSLLAGRRRGLLRRRSVVPQQRSGDLMGGHSTGPSRLGHRRHPGHRAGHRRTAGRRGRDGRHQRPVRDTAEWTTWSTATGGFAVPADMFPTPKPSPRGRRHRSTPRRYRHPGLQRRLHDDGRR